MGEQAPSIRPKRTAVRFPLIIMPQLGDSVKPSAQMSRVDAVEAKARASGKAATVTDYAASYGDQAKVFESAYKLGDGSADVGTFARDYEIAYSWGEVGISPSYVTSDSAVSATSSLTAGQREIAYLAGRDARDDGAADGARLDKGSSLEYNESKRGDMNGEEVAAQDPRRGEKSNEGNDERTQSQDGNGSRVQEETQKRRGVLGEAIVSRRVQSKASERLTVFSEEDIVTPSEGSQEHSIQRTLENEYGISAYVIKESVWLRNAPSFANDGVVYICEGINTGKNRNVTGHEATHVMAQVEYAPYLEFLERTSSMIDMSLDETRDILKVAEHHCEEDFIYNGDESDLRVYDELNATMYEIGLAKGIDKNLLSNTSKVFYDFDAYIAELQSIHEQFKRDNTAKGGEIKPRKKGTLRGVGVKIHDVKKAFGGDFRRDVVAYLRTFAEATGINIVLYRSTVGADGKLVSPVIDGVDLTDSQGGFAWHNDTIYVDINAGHLKADSLGDIRKYSLLRTFAHEFTHFCEKWNPEAYDDFRSLVFEHLESKGKDPHLLIQSKQGATGLGYEAASREVVADAMTDILPETSFLQDILNKNRELFEKLRSMFKKYLRGIKAYFAGLADNNDTAAVALKEDIGGTVRYIEDIVKAFDRLAATAVENYQAAVSDGEADVTVSKQVRSADDAHLDKDGDSGYNEGKDGEINGEDSKNSGVLDGQEGIRGADGSRDSVWTQGNDPEKIYRRLGDVASQKTIDDKMRAGSSGWLGEYRRGRSSLLRFGESVLRNIRGLKAIGVDTFGRDVPENICTEFSDTVLKDKNGRLLSLYHWTDASFRHFRLGDIGFHFGTLKAAYDRYCGVKKKRAVNSSYYKEAYVNIKNPVLIDYDPMTWDAFSTSYKLNERGILSDEQLAELHLIAGFHRGRYDSPAAVVLRKMLADKGYDGIVYTNGHEDGISVIAFDDSQIYTVAENGIDVKHDEGNGGVSYQKRTATLTDRDVLESASERLSGEKLSEGERAALDIFNKRLGELKALQEERARLGSLWHDQQFGDGDRSEARATKNRMDVLDAKIERADASVNAAVDATALKDKKDSRSSTREPEYVNNHSSATTVSVYIILHIADYVKNRFVLTPRRFCGIIYNNEITPKGFTYGNTKQ